MASTSNIVILSSPTELYEILEYPKAANEVIAQGDLLEENGSGAEVVDSADNSVFIGVAVTGSTATEVDPISVMIRGVIQVQLAAAETAAFGGALCWTAGANGTDWTFSAATAEGIVWALEAISAAGSGKALVDVLSLETGKFETVTGSSTSTSTSTTTSTSTSTSSTTTTSTSTSTSSTSSTSTSTTSTTTTSTSTSTTSTTTTSTSSSTTTTTTP